MGRLRESKGARRYNDRIQLMRQVAEIDAYGHDQYMEPEVVLECYASVRQRVANTYMMTEQQGDQVNLEIEFRMPAVHFDFIRWQGHDIHFPTPEILDNRNRVVKVSGYYQVDRPKVI